LKENDKFECVGKVSGADLLGSTVHPPLSAAKEVYVVPMETIKENKVSYFSLLFSIPS